MPNRTTDELIVSRAQQAYIVLEDSPGVPKFPVGAQFQPLAEIPTYNQVPKYSDKPRVQKSLTKRKKTRDRMEYGTLSNLVVSPLLSGALGVAPQEDALWQMITGKKTVNAGTDVTYGLDPKRPTATIWLWVDDLTLSCLAGVCVKSAKTTISQEGELRLSLDAIYSRGYTGGSAKCNATIATGAAEIAFGTDVDVEDLFFPGQKITVDPASGSASLSAAVAVLTVDAIANKITTEAMTIANGPLPINSLVMPYLPAPSEIGQEVELNDAQVYFGAFDAVYGGGSGQLFDPAQMLAAKKSEWSLTYDVKTPALGTLGQLYPPALYVTESREISGSIELLMTAADVKYLQQSLRIKERSVGYQVGTIDGRMVRFCMPSTTIEVPEMSNAEGARMLTFKWQSCEGALGKENEFKVVIK